MPPTFAIGLQVKSYNFLMRKSRMAKGLTQAEMAEIVGVNIQTIQQLETLKINHRLDWDVLDRIAALLERPVQELFPAWLQTKVVREITKGDVAIALSEADAQHSPDVLCGILRAELYVAIESALRTLPARQRKLLDMRFGFSDGSPMTHNQIAIELDVTSERVRQIEATALHRLRRPKIVRELLQAWRSAPEL